LASNHIKGAGITSHENNTPREVQSFWEDDQNNSTWRSGFPWLVIVRHIFGIYDFDFSSQV
jgi:hypothetical protein